MGGILYLIPMCSHSLISKLVTLNPLCHTLVANLWRSLKEWPQLVHIHRPDWKKKKYLSLLTSKNLQALNKSILRKHSQGKWRLNQICHSSAGRYTGRTGIRASTDEGLPAGESSTASFSYFQCLSTSCCSRMWSDVYVHHGRYIKRSDSKVCTREGVTWHWSTATVVINTPTITGSSLPPKTPFKCKSHRKKKKV